MMEIYINHFIGWLAAGFMLLSLSYPLLKKIRLKGKILLRFHYYFGYISIILGSIHALANLAQISFSAGLICFLSMLLIMISGIVMKHLSKVFLKYILVWRCIHVVLAVVCVAALLIHIIKYFLFV